MAKNSQVDKPKCHTDTSLLLELEVCLIYSAFCFMADVNLWISIIFHKCWHLNATML